MREKLYRPIIKDGDHLVKSKENEGRVRGVSQDANNKTTDIIEWEEVEVDDQTYNYEDEDFTLQHSQLTPEQRKLAEMIGTAIAAGIIYGAGKINKQVIQPWWRNTAQPWINNKMIDVKQRLSSKFTSSKTTGNNKKLSNETSLFINGEIDTQIDVMLEQEFKSTQFDMNTEEAQMHTMHLIYHILGIAYEIKILSNSRIANQFEDEKTILENQAKVERILVEKVAENINQLLSDEKLQVDVSTSKQLFNLLGGGIRINREYVPVEIDKIELAITRYKNEINSNCE